MAIQIPGNVSVWRYRYLEQALIFPSFVNGKSKSFHKQASLWFGKKHHEGDCERKISEGKNSEIKYRGRKTSDEW